MPRQVTHSDTLELPFNTAESSSQILNMIKEIDSKLTKTQADVEELKAQVSSLTKNAEIPEKTSLKKHGWFKDKNATETVKMLIEWYSESGDWEPLQKGLLQFLPKSDKTYWQACYTEDDSNSYEVNRNSLYNIGLSGYTELAMLLIDCGMSINLQTFDRDTNTMLHGAAARGRLQLVQALLDRGADIEAENNSHETPIVKAAENNRLEVIKLLVQEGANVKHSTSYGYTSLHEAASHDHLEVVQFLLQSGAMLTQRLVMVTLL